MRIVAPLLVLLGIAVMVFYSVRGRAARSPGQPDSPASRSRAASVEAWLNEYHWLLLGLLWLGYGSTHFLSAESALHQMPPWMGVTVRKLLFAASGAAELAFGIMMLYPALRAASLLLQGALMLALVPFVLFIVTDDCALFDLFRTCQHQGFYRLILVAHNGLLTLWIYHAYQCLSTEERKLRMPRLSYSPTFLVATTLLVANVVGFYAIARSPWPERPLATLWALACLATGGLIGFLFGVPRWVSNSPRSGSAYEPNTNIEQLSDWLTKIMVGVGLIEAQNIWKALQHLSHRLSGGLSYQDPKALAQAEAFALSLIIYFVVAGIIEGFLITRMYLTRAWQPGDQVEPRRLIKRS